MEPDHTRQKDLNIIRSAVNRYLEDQGQPRHLLGAGINRVIKAYREYQLRRDRAEGIESGLHRVPCPEVAIRSLVTLGRTANNARTLRWCGALLVMLLQWLSGPHSLPLTGTVRVFKPVQKKN